MRFWTTTTESLGLKPGENNNGDNSFARCPDDRAWFLATWNQPVILLEPAESCVELFDLVSGHRVELPIPHPVTVDYDLLRQGVVDLVVLGQRTGEAGAKLVHHLLARVRTGARLGIISDPGRTNKT